MCEWFTLPGNSKFGKVNYSDTIAIAELRMIVDRRDVEHDGYCSDPGEDTGEWKFDVIYRLRLNKSALEILTPHISDDGTVRLEILKEMFDSDSTGCGCGSNYCGYDGSIIVKSGKIIYHDQLDIEDIKIRAQWEADKRGGVADDYIPLIKEMDKRKILLSEAMKEKGLNRASKQANKYIETGQPELNNLINGMIELKWCFEYNNMQTELKKYIDENKVSYGQDTFESVRKQILKRNPVPQILPWLTMVK